MAGIFYLYATDVGESIICQNQNVKETKWRKG